MISKPGHIQGANQKSIRELSWNLKIRNTNIDCKKQND